MMLFVTWTVVATLLTSPAVLGFGMIDLLRGARQSDKSPVDAIVNVFLEEMDVNNDSKITLSELGSYVDQILRMQGGNPRGSEVKGYVLTVGSLIDVSDNDQVEKSELHRAASYLVNLGGRKQVGRVLDGLINIKTNDVDRFALAGRIAADLYNIIDSDSDGVINTDEIEVFSNLGMFGWAREYVKQHLREADEDSDGNLSTQELGSFLFMLTMDHRWIFDQLYVYTRVYQLTGIDTANEWAEAPL